jgi:hypothetical protein
MSIDFQLATEKRIFIMSGVHAHLDSRKMVDWQTDRRKHAPNNPIPATVERDCDSPLERDLSSLVDNWSVTDDLTRQCLCWPILQDHTVEQPFYQFTPRLLPCLRMINFRAGSRAAKCVGELTIIRH